jgi:hypothetical protein
MNSNNSTNDNDPNDPPDDDNNFSQDKDAQDIWTGPLDELVGACASANKNDDAMYGGGGMDTLMPPSKNDVLFHPDDPAPGKDRHPGQDPDHRT